MGDSIRFMINNGADVNKLLAGKHASALMVAIYAEEEDNIAALLEGGANPNLPLTGEMALYGSPLTMATLSGRTQVMRRVIEAGADVNSSPVGKYGSALIAAAYIGEKDCVECLIDAGANVNLQVENAPFASALQAAKTPMLREDYVVIRGKDDKEYIEACLETLPEKKAEVVRLLEQDEATA
ncbi:hypothetical protein N7448_009319 [Penicillium atrosanguineum]|uniref:Ankyrin repeat domain-containing protein n=1 Tax=Penicillium atrosanguineum TaxID=1132637 RepID=A0A9W9KW83_9EURO|nr:uncharacterized protein N7443_006569 [Penicillium atrosanguineum]KAJ5123222.1 hypothetical protein N7448_009319 [Penicillium atrosanguineum]KAJ5141853.1 hypothetical protein N7526_002848 [Penicillium atrosanguineum]KAJ5298449.1 hypothetical protein N7443_006569 [Penicillium atrosanguineum]KAJ5321284.1 hypothetical protein N7476_004286 [Penicillium atrosanguineum]